MTSIELRQPEIVQLTNEQIQFIAGTEFVPRELRGNLPAIMAAVATGRALGLDDMTALRTINVIDGRPSFSAELDVLLVRRRGHSIQGEVLEGRAVARGKRADNGDEITVEWTLAMAERAGLLAKQNWKKYPEAMLWARAVTALCRMLFADCFVGGTYTPEELGSEEAPAADAAAGAAGAPAEYAEEEHAAEPPPYIDDAWPGPGESVPAAPPAEAEASADPGAGDDDPSEATPSVEGLWGVVTPPPDDDGLFPPPGVEQGITEAQERLLNMLVGNLREHGFITTDQVWRSVGYEPEKSEDGEVHWSPLRARLTKDQASALIDRLSRYQEQVAPGGFYMPRSPKDKE